MGDVLREALDARFSQHPNIGDIRGRGMFLGLEIVADRDSKPPFPPDAKIAPRLKAAAFEVSASEMGGRVVDRVVQIYGGAGYLAEYEAERYFRDARIYRIYEGTTQILQLQIAKHMLREWEAANG